MTATLNNSIQELRGLQGGWDGHACTPKPTKVAIDRAEQILNVEPTVQPNRLDGGGVLIRWRSQTGNLIAEIAIDPEGDQHDR